MKKRILLIIAALTIVGVLLAYTGYKHMMGGMMGGMMDSKVCRDAMKNAPRDMKVHHAIMKACENLKSEEKNKKDSK